MNVNNKARMQYIANEKQRSNNLGLLMLRRTRRRQVLRIPWPVTHKSDDANSLLNSRRFDWLYTRHYNWVDVGSYSELDLILFSGVASKRLPVRKEENFSFNTLDGLKESKLRISWQQKAFLYAASNLFVDKRSPNIEKEYVDTITSAVE